MNYLAPVINHVHNNLSTNLSLRLSGGRYSLPAGQTTVLDFDIMSVASDREQSEIFYAVAEGYLAVDILVLCDGEYKVVGKYTATKQQTKEVKPVVQPVATTTADRAKDLGVKVYENKPASESYTVIDPKETVKEPVKEEPVKEEPVKEEPKKEEPKKEEPVKEEPALKSVKNNVKKDK